MTKIFYKLFFTAFALTVACTSSQPTRPHAPAAPLPTSHIKYERKTWGQWQDPDRDCQNTRHELLVKESLVPVTLSDNGCRALTGKWMDFYTGEFLTNSADIEVDHVVPVKIAHDLGGAHWDKEQKRKYYNDTDNLVLTSKKNNAQKSANDITIWQPANKQRACAQAQKWFLIKRRYGLQISDTEIEYAQLLTGCKGLD